MGQRFLIDTNAIIDFSENKLPEAGKVFLSEILDSEPCISVVTKIELLGFAGIGQPIIDFVNESLVIGLTDEVVEQTITLRRKHKIKLPDAIIAATALVEKATIVSHNTRDFQNIKKLKCVDPHAL
ncbi:type II toxin-antitoxin system VapC family toxin [Fibrella aquatica]|uniref:type II toxin-antitoxin system VapC family toxin n=1 Tax=Fibrella aquatica TaxID=3242487 RepID=UPI0035217633